MNPIFIKVTNTFIVRHIINHTDRSHQHGRSDQVSETERNKTLWSFIVKKQRYARLYRPHAAHPGRFTHWLRSAVSAHLLWSVLKEKFYPLHLNSRKNIKTHGSIFSQ